MLTEKDYNEFISLVKRMRDAQKEFENQPPFKWGDTSVLRRSRKLESEVDEYLKKIEL